MAPRRSSPASSRSPWRAAAAGGDAPRGRRPAAEARRRSTSCDAAAQPPDDASEIEQLLRERARALEARTRAALAAHRDGRASARATAARAAGASGCAIERIRLVADELETTGDRATASVTMSYRVRGMSRPFTTARADRAQDGRRLAREPRRAAARAAAVGGRRVPGARGRPHVVLLTPPGVDPGALRAGLERGLPRDPAATCRAATCRAACS